MFRRRWSGLPKDPEFPNNLKGLGYFINEQDEVRSIEKPDTYFKYFIKKNERWNERQRFAMNNALSKIIEKRLYDLGCWEVPLRPFKAENPGRVPVLITTNAPTSNHIVVIIGESTQDLGVLAHRVIGGPGGINKGSLVDTVKYFRNGETGMNGDIAVAIANPGQCLYWPEGKRCLTDVAWNQKPRRSAVTYGEKIDLDRNIIEGHQTAKEHIQTFFEKVVQKGLLQTKGVKPSVRGDIKTMSIIALGNAAEVVEGFLNEKENWDTYGPHLVSLAIVGGFFDREQITNPAFAEFMRKRARAYIVSQEPTDTPIAQWTGNPLASHFTDYGCPVFSSGEPYYTETMFITAHKSICDFILTAATDPDYANPEMEVTYVDEAVVQNLTEDENPWAGEQEKRLKEKEADEETKAIEALKEQTAELKEQEEAFKLQKEKIEEEIAAMQKDRVKAEDENEALEEQDSNALHACGKNLGHLNSQDEGFKGHVADEVAKVKAVNKETNAKRERLRSASIEQDVVRGELEMRAKELGDLMTAVQAKQLDLRAEKKVEVEEVGAQVVTEEWPEKVQHWNVEQAKQEIWQKDQEAKLEETQATFKDISVVDGDQAEKGKMKRSSTEQWPERVQHWSVEQAALGNKDLEKVQAEVAAGEASPMRLVAEEFAAKCAVGGESVTISEETGGSPAITLTPPPSSLSFAGNCSCDNPVTVQESMDSLMKLKREIQPEAEAEDEEIPHSLSAKCCNP